MAETLVLRGTLEGHEGWVTSIATPQNLNSDVIISASRDKTLLVWKITREEGNYGYPLRSLHGHSHFVEVRASPPPACPWQVQTTLLNVFLSGAVVLGGLPGS